MIKAIIFDCFGVLLTDALTTIVDDLRSIDPEKAARITATIQLASNGHIHAAESRKLVAAELGLDPEDYSQQIRDGEVRNIQLFELIKELRKSYKTALLSNISSEGLQIRFPNNELEQYFDTVVASGDVGMAKPDPRIYVLTCERLRVSPKEALFIDDIPEYVEAARAEGLTGIVYDDLYSFRSQLNELLNTNY